MKVLDGLGEALPEAGVRRVQRTGPNMALKLRDLLRALNRGQENALEPWGFTVIIGSAAAPKRRAKDAAQQPPS